MESILTVVSGKVAKQTTDNRILAESSKESIITYRGERFDSVEDAQKYAEREAKPVPIKKRLQPSTGR